jgi:hypothetical protein
MHDLADKTAGGRPFHELSFVPAVHLQLTHSKMKHQKCGSQLTRDFDFAFEFSVSGAALLPQARVRNCNQSRAQQFAAVTFYANRISSRAVATTTPLQT